MESTRLIHSIDDQKPRKRGRPPKTRISGGQSDSPTIQTPQQATHPIAPQIQTPLLQAQVLSPPSNIAPTQSSPPKPTPNKTVIKALPTVRDHTTDQLSPEGDEYIPREYDEAGEKKVSPTGRPLENREYKCRTFLVPNRGDKLFMLATECARVLGYRDSYLLFNKNRSLFKIIATQPEKDDLIHQEILPYSYRSRQIAIVTAKSMFRQFGSRVILNGRRVRDDYWEAKARKQGFTEEDAAGEKRPGGAKAAREAAALEATNAVALGHHPDIIYSNGPPHIPIDAHGHPQALQSAMGIPMAATLAPLPMIHLAPSEDMRLRDYGNIPRPRQEITGTAYQDRTQPSSANDIMNQAVQNADYNKIVNRQAIQRGKFLEDLWKQPRDVPATTPQQRPNETSPAISQSLQSPPPTSNGMMNSSHQSLLQHQPSQMMTSQAYSQQSHQQTAPAQSPIRSMPQQMRSDQMQHRPSSSTYGAASASQGSPYGYPQPSQNWGQPPPQPHQSPISATHHAGLPQYAQPQQQQQQQQQQSQQPQQQLHHHQPHPSHSPHPSQSPHQHPPSVQHSQGNSAMQSGMGYQGMTNMGQAGYAGMSVGGRSIYQQPQSQSPQTYMQGQTTAGGHASLQGWAPPPQPQQQQQGHAGQQGWPGY